MRCGYIFYNDSAVHSSILPLVKDLTQLGDVELSGQTDLSTASLDLASFAYETLQARLRATSGGPEIEEIVRALVDAKVQYVVAASSDPDFGSKLKKTFDAAWKDGASLSSDLGVTAAYHHPADPLRTPLWNEAPPKWELTPPGSGGWTPRR